jgi:solute carrier family 25 carnitine/acylcarnitine transporter 20/29
MGVGAAVSIQFGVNENAKKALMNMYGTNQLSLGQLCVCGLLAGLANCIVTIPAEHIRIRMQTQSSANPLYSSSMDCIKKISNAHGAKGVYLGTYATLAREGVAYATYFTAYAWIMQQLLKPGQTRNDLSYAKVGFAGAASGMLLWLGSYPLDVIKTKIQTDSLERPQYKGVFDCASKIMKNNGIGGFFKGFTPCIARSLPVNAGTFIVYEKIIRTLNGQY